MTTATEPERGNMREQPKYVHALRFRWLNRLYDPVVRWTTKEQKFKRLLVEQVAAGDSSVLDLGCGTATLTLMLKRAYPEATVAGLDGDPSVLDIARQKTELAGVEIALHQGLADAPPFDDGAFDRIVSSLMFHHLDRDAKQRTFRRARALFRPGGELHIADWGRAQNPLMRAAFLGVQLLDGFGTTTDNVQGRLPAMMEGAGFEDVEETHREMTMFGTLSLYRARNPSGREAQDAHPHA